MPRGGHNAKPTHLKVIQGTYRADRARGDEPKPRPLAPKPPPGLDRDALGVWRSLAPVVVRLGLFSELDGHLFAMLCSSWARWQGARRRLSGVQRQETRHTAPGQVTLDALRLIRKAEISVEQAEHSFRMLAWEFGLSPGSRSRLNVQAPIASADDDAFEEFLRGSAS